MICIDFIKLLESITLQAQVESALRQRPDVIILGEIRSREAYSFFQALSTGHGALSTIHAEDIGSLLRRLAGPPMNVPKPLLGMVRSFVHIVRLTLPEGIRRKVIVIHESLGYDPVKDSIDIQEIIVWDRSRDKWIMYTDRKSALIRSIASLLRLSYDDVYSDLKRRATIIHWAAKRKFDMYRLHKTVREYRRNPENIYKQAVVEVGEYEI